MPTSQNKPVDCSELAASLAELALAHGEAGAKTLDEVVERMRKDLPDLDRDQIADAIVAYSRRAKTEPVSKDELKTRIADLKKEARDDSRVRAQIADLEHQLKTGEIKMPTPRAKRVLNERMEQLLYERDKIKSDVNREIRNREEKGIFTTLVGEPFDEARAWLTTGEFSGVGRQGGFFAIGNPIEAAEASAKMIEAFKSPAKAHAFDMSIRPGNENSRKYAMWYDRADLHLPDPEISSVRKRAEEMFQSDLPVTRAISKLTHVPLDRVPEKFGRAYITGLNAQRVARFDAIAETLTKNGDLNLPEAKAIAGFINAATGRGNLGKFAAAAKVMNALFFAPRYTVSRFEMALEPLRALAAQPANPAIRAFNKATGKSIEEMDPHMWGGTLRTDKAIAKEYAKYLAGVSIVLSIASQVPGVEVEKDPRSSDFGKIRIGDTRLDLLSGFQQAAVLMAKQITSSSKSGKTGEVEDMDAQKWIENATRFLRTKASPLAGTALDVWLGEDVTGQPVKPFRSGKDAAKFGLGLISPITWRDIIKTATQDMGIPAKAAISAAAILGAGVQIYDPSLPNAPDDRLTVPKEERDLDPNLPEKVKLTTDEYADLLQAHEAALVKIEKERKKPSFQKMSKKEQAQTIDEIYRDDYGPKEGDIVESAILRLSK